MCSMDAERLLTCVESYVISTYKLSAHVTLNAETRSTRIYDMVPILRYDAQTGLSAVIRTLQESYPT